jgi:hypothetical protein
MRSSSVLLAVSIRIGVTAVARSSRAMVSPGTSGRPRSRITRSGGPAWAIVIASAPEPVDSTMNPARSR